VGVKHSGKITITNRVKYGTGQPDPINPSNVPMQINSYVGNEASVDIVNGLDIAGNGGLVWIKQRGGVSHHQWFDTQRGIGVYSSSDYAMTDFGNVDRLTSFNSDGATVGSNIHTNRVNNGFISWQWMKSEGFFDIVTYSGNSVMGRELPINLDDGGSAEFGMAIVKCRNRDWVWVVQHRSIPETQRFVLSSSNVAATSNTWADTRATTTTLYLGWNTTENFTGMTYVAYLFAHNPSKGIYCGSYTGTGGPGNKVTLGFRPKWVMVKSKLSGPWAIFDNVRGMDPGNSPYLEANLARSEVNTANLIADDDGFILDTVNAINENGVGYVFVAIAI